MTNPLWQLDNITLDGIHADRLSDVELRIDAGVTAVMGESGAGKTSLLNLLVGFEQPTSGTITRGAGVEQTSVAWVPVDLGLWPSISVIDHLLKVMPIPDGQAGTERTEAEHWLERFQISQYANGSVTSLSMGEQSRLSVARALATEADVIVMDEPLTHVDAQHLGAYWSVIRDHLRKQNASLIFASHSAEVVLREADQVFCFDDGRVIWNGDVDALYASPPTEQLARFLGPVNWFDAESTARWLARESAAGCAIRPEALQVVPSSSGPLTVVESKQIGAMTETEATYSDSDESRRIIHLSGGVLEAGMRVALNTLTLLLFLCGTFFMSGCADTREDGPSLKFSEVEHHSLPAEGVMLPAPRGMTFSPEGELFVLDNAGRMIVYGADGEYSRRWWMPEYDVGKPEGAWVLLDGRIAVADTHYHRVVFFDQKGTVLGMFGERGEGPGQFLYTIAVTQDPHGFLYIAENGGNDRIQKFDPDGNHVLTIGSCGIEPGEFQRPSGIVWDDGELIVADAINNRIQVFKDDGTFLRIIADESSAGLYYPYDLAQAPDGTLFVPEYGRGRVTQLSKTGKVLARFGKEGRNQQELWTPWGIAVSPLGRIAIADTGNHRVVEIDR